jgi:hypothetical protein
VHVKAAALRADKAQFSHEQEECKPPAWYRAVGTVDELRLSLPDGTLTIRWFIGRRPRTGNTAMLQVCQASDRVQPFRNRRRVPASCSLLSTAVQRPS